MFKISAQIQAKSLLNDLAKFQKQIPFATARALTKTAQDVMAEDKREIAKVFDKPTPYALNSLFLQPAKKDKLIAKVWVKDDVFKGTPAEKFLSPNIEGSTRKTKRYERALIAAGVMPAGYFAVPGDAAPLDNYGNIPSRFIVQLLSYFRSFGEAGYTANMTAQGKIKFENRISKRVGQNVKYFAVGPGNRLTPGIYMRVSFSSGSAIKPVMIFVKSASYAKRFDFFGVSQRVSDAKYRGHLDESIRIAIATAR